MQLSSRILTALAVLILAVAVVAVRAGSPGTVEAATGTIDVVNVGTCYTTDEEVFGVSDCDDGDEDAYLVAGRERHRRGWYGLCHLRFSTPQRRPMTRVES